MQHYDIWIDGRQNFLLFIVPNQRRLPCRATQGVAPGTGYEQAGPAGYSFYMARKVVLLNVPLPVDWLM